MLENHISRKWLLNTTEELVADINHRINETRCGAVLHRILYLRSHHWLQASLQSFLHVPIPGGKEIGCLGMHIRLLYVLRRHTKIIKTTPLQSFFQFFQNERSERWKNWWKSIFLFVALDTNKKIAMGKIFDFPSFQFFQNERSVCIVSKLDKKSFWITL